jgi:hypothetical protein
MSYEQHGMFFGVRMTTDNTIEPRASFKILQVGSTGTPPTEIGGPYDVLWAQELISQLSIMLMTDEAQEALATTIKQIKAAKKMFDKPQS